MYLCRLYFPAAFLMMSRMRNTVLWDTAVSGPKL